MADLARCDQDVYENGSVVCIISGMPSACVEAAVAQARKSLDGKIDWHYAAGRAVVKTTGDVPRARKLFHWIDSVHLTSVD